MRRAEDGLSARGYSADDILRITEGNARELLSGER